MSHHRIMHEMAHYTNCVSQIWPVVPSKKNMACCKPSKSIFPIIYDIGHLQPRHYCPSHSLFCDLFCSIGTLASLHSSLPISYKRPNTYFLLEVKIYCE